MITFTIIGWASFVFIGVVIMLFGLLGFLAVKKADGPSKDLKACFAITCFGALLIYFLLMHSPIILTVGV